jgi:protein ImuB
VVTVQLPPERAFSKEDFLKKIVTPLQALGLQAKVGMAGTPDLALLAARRASPVYIVRDAAAVLSPLPVSVLQPSEELGSILESWGVRSVAQLVALPMTQVCERLGPEAVELWERAKGGRVRPLDLVKPREFFVEEIDLENFVELLETLLFLLRRFLEQLTTRLGNAYLVAGKMRLVLRFEDGSTYQRVFTVPEPTRDVEVLFRILHTHLENFVSESPIVGLELAAKPVRPGAEQFGLLEKGVRDPHQLAETVGRLKALLGPERVGTPQGARLIIPTALCCIPMKVSSSPTNSTKAPFWGCRGCDSGRRCRRILS